MMADVTVVMEMPAEVYDMVRGQIFQLITEFGMTCHVTMGEAEKARQAAAQAAAQEVK